MKKNAKKWLLGAAGVLAAVALVVAVGSGMRGGFVKATDSDIAQGEETTVPVETQVSTGEIVVETTEETKAEPETEATEAETTVATEAAEAETQPLEVSLECEVLGELDYGVTVRLTAHVTGADPDAVLRYIWQYSLDGENWQNVENAETVQTLADEGEAETVESSDVYEFILDEVNGNYYWRVLVEN